MRRLRSRLVNSTVAGPEVTCAVLVDRELLSCARTASRPGVLELVEIAMLCIFQLHRMSHMAPSPQAAV
jgi:hypothetical protein